MTLDVIKVGPLGPYDNNSYIIVDEATNESLLIDAPFGVAKAVEAAKGTNVQRIVVTHRHGDHWAEIDVAREGTGAPVYCHEGDRQPYAAKVAGTLAHGEEIALGESSIAVLHTPGHTPGSICLLVQARDGDVLISGDTLFPGGPGRSDNPAALKEMVASIAAHLLRLPPETRVYPGHGDNTTIGDAQREHAVFASKPHAADLCGDVTWVGS